MKVIYSAISVKDILDGSIIKGQLCHLSGESSSYVLDTTIGRDVKERIRVPFFVSSFVEKGLHESVKAIITICKTSQWKALNLFVKKAYPRLVPILLSQADLIRSAKSFRQVIGHNVNVKALSAKETFNGNKGKDFKSVRIWTDEILEKALISIQHRSQIIISLDLEFFQKIDEQTHILPKATCKIRKNGEIEVTGSYKLAFDTVATQIARVGEKKLRFFSGRGLRSTEYKPKPLSVSFIQPVFEKLDAIHAFVKTLSKYPHSMHAVVHGNPYAHVKLTDILDGSSFDVWAISPYRIAIMPGFKASEAALERLIHYIFDNFREGDIADYDLQGRTLESCA